MSGKEKFVQSENGRLVDKIKGFNEITRNIQIGVVGIAYFFAQYGIAATAAIGATIDQGIIILADLWKKRRQKQQYKPV